MHNEAPRERCELVWARLRSITPSDTIRSFILASAPATADAMKRPTYSSPVNETEDQKSAQHMCGAVFVLPRLLYSNTDNKMNLKKYRQHSVAACLFSLLGRWRRRIKEMKESKPKCRPCHCCLRSFQANIKNINFHWGSFMTRHM